MSGVRAGAWGGRDSGREVQVDAHCRCLSHDVSDLALEAVEESCNKVKPGDRRGFFF